MPRPKLNRERFNITLPPEVVKLLDAVARKEGVTRSDLIEEAVNSLLVQRERREKPRK